MALGSAHRRRRARYGEIPAPGQPPPSSRIMAVALDDEGKGAATESAFTVRKPVMLVPIVPRFAMAGIASERRRCSTTTSARRSRRRSCLRSAGAARVEVLPAAMVMGVGRRAEPCGLPDARRGAGRDDAGVRGGRCLGAGARSDRVEARAGGGAGPRRASRARGRVLARAGDRGGGPRGRARRSRARR